jgi:hypothetical protein
MKFVRLHPYIVRTSSVKKFSKYVISIKKADHKPIKSLCILVFSFMVKGVVLGYTLVGINDNFRVLHVN